MVLSRTLREKPRSDEHRGGDAWVVSGVVRGGCVGGLRADSGGRAGRQVKPVAVEEGGGLRGRRPVADRLRWSGGRTPVV